MKIRHSLVTLLILAASCGDDKKDTPAATPTTAPTATTTIKYSQVSAFVGSYCSASGCHDATTKSGSFNTTTRAGIALKATTAAARIELASNPMPPTGSAQKTSFDKETAGKANLLEWLKAGAPE